MYRLSAETTGAGFRGEENAAGGNDPEPATGTQAGESLARIGLEIPHRVIAVAEEHGSGRGRHGAASAPAGHLDGHGVARAEVERLGLGVHGVAHDDRVLHGSAVVRPVVGVGLLPKRLPVGGVERVNVIRVGRAQCDERVVGVT